MTSISTDPKDRKIRVALIGCGAIAEQMHLPVLAGHPTLQLVALVDRNTERARKFATGYGVSTVLEDAQQLTRDMVDAAIVASPAFHHAPCTIDLVRKGIHVLVEKPMATNLADAERMVMEADKAGVILAVGFFRRLYPSLQLMKALLDSGWAGSPQRFLVEGGGMYNWAAATLGNMRRDLAGGGVLIDFGSHMIDLMYALFDEPAELLAYQDNAIGGIESDCNIDVRVQHAGRRIEGRIELARTRMLGSLIRVECERATLEFQTNERFRIRVTPRGTLLTDPISKQVRGFWFDAAWCDGINDEPWYATFGRQFDDWIHAIQAGRQPTLSGRSALATSRLIENSYAKPTLMHEPWVWHGIPQPTMVDPSNEQSKNAASIVPAVHAAGRQERVLVTGASGFIGSRVAELLRLRDQCDVRAAVHNPGNASRLARLDIEMVQADLSNPADAERLVRDCDSVIHCAIGTNWAEPHKIASVTVGGTQRLAEAALSAGIKRFVHVSTMSVYGDDGLLTGVLDENTPVSPVSGSVYGKTKADAERLVLELSKRGLPGVVFRPARVYGPFSNIFITRPLQAIAAGNFQWLGSPDVPADMVYVDNVAQALIAATRAEASSVIGQAFNIGDGDTSTWREFYQYFASHLGLDLSKVTIKPLSKEANVSGLGCLIRFPGRVVGGIGSILGSKEFKSLGRRSLDTDPIGTLPRKMLEKFPSLERSVRKLIGADDSLPIYHAEEAAGGDDWVHMGSGGSVLSIDKLKNRIGYDPPVSRENALQLTLEWARHAKVGVSGKV
jgi:predicted dehydrogenase/nucleoside-diphosphate-sugar epimerase